MVEMWEWLAWKNSPDWRVPDPDEDDHTDHEPEPESVTEQGENREPEGKQHDEPKEEPNDEFIKEYLGQVSATSVMMTM